LPGNLPGFHSLFPGGIRDEGGRKPFEIRVPQGQRVARAWRIRLGEVGNQMQADRNSFPEFILQALCGKIALGAAAVTMININE